MKKRLTSSNNNYACRVRNCPMKKYLEELFFLNTITNIDVNDIYECDACPFEEVYNRLVEYEDKDSELNRD